VAVGQVSPCGTGQVLNSGASITSGTPTYYSASYVSAANVGVNVTGSSVAGSANVTMQAGTAICLGVGFRAAATGSGGGFTALIGATPPSGEFAVPTATLASASVGTAYSQPLTAVGGTPAYTWTLTGGTLSASGLSLTSGGIVTGTPTSTGTFSLNVYATDVTGAATAVQTFNVTVSASAIPPSASMAGRAPGRHLPR
jgi:hypothetical protein